MLKLLIASHPNREMSKTVSFPLIALTGGIGSGKSTVSAKLAELGACVIDSDMVARDVVIPGTKGLDMVVDRFGDAVLASDGSLDRAKLAGTVFSDPAALNDLNGILHPLIEEEIKKRVVLCMGKGNTPIIVVIPLLFETNAIQRYGFSKVIVVDLPEEVAIQRVVASRGMTEGEVRERIERQATRDTRLSRADFVIDNSSSSEALDSQVTQLWDQLKAMF